MTPRFVHLTVMSEYALSCSAVRLAALIKQLNKQQALACGLVDRNNLFAMVKFYTAARAAGIKPLIGSTLLVDQGAKKPAEVRFLVQNRTGLLRLNSLLSQAWLARKGDEDPQVPMAWLEEGDNSGLLAMSDGLYGAFAQSQSARDEGSAKRLLDRWRHSFPDAFYLTVSRLGAVGEIPWLSRAVDWSIHYGVPLLASNEVVFLSPDDFEPHEARVCIAQGRALADPRRKKRFTPQQYLRSEAEMVALFADLPEAISNTVAVAARCNLELELGKNVLPDFPVPEGMSTATYMNNVAKEGLRKRLDFLQTAEQDQPDYWQRLERELGVIEDMDFPGYFLIVADFIRWAKEQAIPVGPGRGSGAGSLVAYALGITDLDPMAYDLLFERFLNPERVSMPDFDIDFCMDRRDEVIAYVADHYGRDRVSQIITYGRMAAKAVVRDVGRVQGHPYGFVDRVAKLIPFELSMTLPKALASSDDLRAEYDKNEEVRALIDLAMRLEGLARNAGKHAGGVVISPTALTDFCPLYKDSNSGSVVTQFDKNDVESVGLVKFDFLGLRTLTIIDWAIQNINKSRLQCNKDELDIALIPLADKATYQLMQRGETTAVFQLESRGMQQLIKKLLPDCFEDVIALVALFRPGPLQSGMVDDFVDRKHGRAEVSYPHPDLEPVLNPTYGVFLYQEQVMQAAQVLAGYSLGGADLLRRAMGKKKPEEMAQQRAIFLVGTQKKGLSDEQANAIFDLMEKFAEYGFNKSHSAAYALLSYQTAWLKQHHPAAFMAAVMSSERDDTDKMLLLIKECRRMGLEVAAPCINHSELMFTVQNGAIRYALSAIKGVGDGAVEDLIQCRQEGGEFSGLEDFLRRVDLRKINRRVLEALIRSGALDAINANRAALFAALNGALQQGEQHARDQRTGQHSLFAASVVEKSSDQLVDTEVQDWDILTRLQAEKTAMGFYFSGHPIDAYLGELKHFVSRRLSQVRATEARKVMRLAGFPVQLRQLTTKQGKQLNIVTLDDHSAQMEVVVDEALMQQKKELLYRQDELLVMEVQIHLDRFSGRERSRVLQVLDLNQAREAYARCLQIYLSDDVGEDADIATLGKLLATASGSCPVRLHYHNAEAVAVLQLPQGIRPGQTLEQELNDLVLVQSHCYIYQEEQG